MSDIVSGDLFVICKKLKTEEITELPDDDSTKIGVESMSYSVIGGADGPTSIYLAGTIGNRFEMIFQVMTMLIIVCFVMIFLKGISQWKKNNQSPRLEVEAKIVSKRHEVTTHRHPNAGDATGAHGFHTTISNSYYVTFQVVSGDRMEFTVSESEYDILAEGDSGKLMFQGTRYLGFDREGKQIH